MINKAQIEIPPRFANQPPVNPVWPVNSTRCPASTLSNSSRSVLWLVACIRTIRKC